MKVEFRVGCFDSFQGTQAELDAVVQRITDIAEFGCCERAIDTIAEPFGATAIELNAVMVLLTFGEEHVRH